MVIFLVMVFVVVLDRVLIVVLIMVFVTSCSWS